MAASSGGSVGVRVIMAASRSLTEVHNGYPELEQLRKWPKSHRDSAKTKWKSQSTELEHVTNDALFEEASPSKLSLSLYFKFHGRSKTQMLKFLQLKIYNDNFARARRLITTIRSVISAH